MSGSANSNAARKCLTKYLRRKFSYILSSYIYIPGCHIIYLLFKSVSRLSCAEIEVCGTIICSLKSTFAGSFIFDLPRKFLFLDFCCQEKKINVLGLVSCTQFLNYSVESVAHMQLKLYYLLVKYLSCIILY
jgi:hypothetical protein